MIVMTLTLESGQQPREAAPAIRHRRVMASDIGADTNVVKGRRQFNALMTSSNNSSSGGLLKYSRFAQIPENFAITVTSDQDDRPRRMGGLDRFSRTHRRSFPDSGKVPDRERR
jgi:hypothetical protein